MRIASHCVPMDGPCAYNTNPPFPSLRTPCRGSPGHAVFTLTSAVVKFANDYASFSLLPSGSSPVRTAKPLKRYPLASSERTLRYWFKEYRYCVQRYQCHRYRSVTLLRKNSSVQYCDETLEKMCKLERISQTSSTGYHHRSFATTAP